ncbi:Putative nitroreductase [Mycobacteroides abscessus subsp. abscessus]|nr:Putative nitroreductase [Mycobacteroides abscessus subsp. abscessus]
MRAGNWACFGASTALFCYLDRDMPRYRNPETKAPEMPRAALSETVTFL